jgi:hypothetical protein
MGKTQLALRYAEINNSRYRTIVHFNARSELDLINDIQRFYDFLIDKKDERLENTSTRNPNDKVDAVIKWFEEEDSWLLIYDNIDLGQFEDFEKYIPHNSLGHRIMISRVPQFGRFTRKFLELKAMEPSDAVPMLLERSAAKKSPNYPHKSCPERQIVSELGGMPGFIEAAAGLILKDRLSLDDYLRLLKNQRENMRLGHQGAFPGDATASLDLNLTSLKQNQKSMWLLSLFSFLDGAELSYDLL